MVAARVAGNPDMLLAAHRPRPRNFHNATHRVVELVLAHGIGDGVTVLGDRVRWRPHGYALRSRRADSILDVEAVGPNRRHAEDLRR